MQKLYDILVSLRNETQETISNSVSLEPAGKSDANKEETLRLQHYKTPDGHPRVFAWARVVPTKGCVSVGIKGDFLKNADRSKMTHLIFKPNANFQSAQTGGVGEWSGRIHYKGDAIYIDVRYALMEACRFCLGD